MSVFFIVVTVVWVAAHVYLARRLVDPSAIADRPLPKWLARLAIAALCALPLITMSFRAEARPETDAPWLIGFAAMGLSSILIALVMTADLFVLAGRGVRRVWPASQSQGRASDAGPDPARRRFFGDLGRASLVGSAGGLSALGYVHATRIPEVHEVDVPISDLPEALEGYRVVQLTDIHIGPTIHGEWLEAVVEAVNALEPDLVAVTGDVVDGHVETLRREVAPLGKLRGRDGVYYVTGNHEYYWDGHAWSEHFASLGLRVLTNAHHKIERGDASLLVGGVTDYRAGRRVPGHRSDPRAALAGAPQADLKLLLAHQPRSIYAAAEAGWQLQLSGHTHGGQYLPFSLMIGLFQPYGHGLHRHEDSQIYVSRGTGYWGPPNRFGSPSEITLLTLRRASA